jgi:hypothetical protein
MNNENQIIKKNIKTAIKSLNKSLMVLYFEAPYCNVPTLNQILFLINRLDEVRKGLQKLTRNNSLSKFDL